jgi:hypothetical protein
MIATERVVAAVSKETAARDALLDAINEHHDWEPWDAYDDAVRNTAIETERARVWERLTALRPLRRMWTIAEVLAVLDAG